MSDAPQGADNLLPDRPAVQRGAVGGELSQHLLHSKNEGNEHTSSDHIGASLRGNHLATPQAG